ncbi:MAG TPA: DUF4019 domain-containing protein [Sphingomicrobium sp.]|nr:DUF4019 domain-containing protein [Sphingomicrobium sp.]
MLSILLAFALGAQAEAPNPQPDLVAAKGWVRLIDAQRWEESWVAAGALFKSRVPELRWASTIEPVRQPLGAVSSRNVKSVTRSKSLPGAPDGDYEVVQFQTQFANKADATETVVLSREASGWKVDGYFIR